MWSTPFNPFSWDKSSQRVTTHMASLEVRDGNGNLIPISGLSPGITILVPLGQPAPYHTIKSLGKLGVLRHHNISVKHEHSMVEILIVPQDSQITISYLKVTQPNKVSPRKTPLECKRAQGEWFHKGSITCKGKTNVTILLHSILVTTFLNQSFVFSKTGKRMSKKTKTRSNASGSRSLQGHK